MSTLQPVAVVNRATLAISLVLLATPILANELTVRTGDRGTSLPTMTAPDPATQERIRNALGKLPLHFEANTGQTDAQVKFLSRTAGYTLFLTPTEAVLTLAPKTKPSPQPQRERGSNLASASGTTAGMPDSRDGGGRAASETAAEGVGQSRGHLPREAGDPQGCGELEQPKSSCRDEGNAIAEDLETASSSSSQDEAESETAVLRLHWLNANPDPKVSGVEPQLGKSAYFIGSDSTQWRSNVAHYAKVRYAAVYPGIDLVYYGNQSRIEYDFVVAPGADPNQIRLAIDGAQSIHLDADGNLVLATARGELLQQAPVIYQEIKGKHVPIEGQYVLHDNHEVSFQIAAYDVERTLIIDPLLQATFLGGGSDDSVTALAIHPVSGDVYVAGSTQSSDFPGIAGGADVIFASGFRDTFIARLNSTLTSLIQATFLGGSDGNNDPTALGIHPVSGDVYVAGRTEAPDFPGIAGGADTTAVGTEVFVARLNSNLTSLTQATFLGGSSGESTFSFSSTVALAIHPVSGNVYVAGDTESNDFPGIAGGADTSFVGTSEAFVARLNSALTDLMQVTFLGGSIEDIATALAIHPVSGDVYVAGSTTLNFATPNDFPGIAGGADTTFNFTDIREAFVARLNNTLTSLIQATYLGGSGSDVATALAIHPVSGDVYVAGNTNSGDFPAIAGGADTSISGPETFVARLNNTLTVLTQATFLGGPDTSGDPIEVSTALAIHPTTGDVYVAGYTDSNDFPGFAGGADTTLIGQEAFVARLNNTLNSLIQATFLGGGSDDSVTALAIHPISGDVYVAGSTQSSDFPGITGGADTTFDGVNDAFITRLTADLLGTDTDLSLALSANPNPVGVNATLTYSHTITNNGPLSASAVVFIHTLPASGMSFSAATSSQGSCSGTATVTCALGTLANGASATVAITVTTTATGTLTSSASVSATQPDPNAANNSAVANVSVVQTICSNAGQRSASTDCSASVGPSAKGGGGAFDPFLLAGLLLLYLGRYWRNIRFAPAMAGRARK